MTDYYAIKVMHPVESLEVSERIEWCKENGIEFFNRTILGCHVGGRFYIAEEMQETGVLQIGSKIGEAEIDLSTLPAINIGMVFVFKLEEDALAFKLAWT